MDKIKEHVAEMLEIMDGMSPELLDELRNEWLEKYDKDTSLNRVKEIVNVATNFAINREIRKGGVVMDAIST